MYATRVFKFSLKNTSKIALNYFFKIVDSKLGTSKEAPYSIKPSKGSITPGCDETYVVKFAPTEIEPDFSRLICCKIGNLNPDQEPLILELDGVGERPVCHFELPPSFYKEKKERDMTPIDSKYNIIDF
jgi:hydrocephalus-inducing protein